LAGEKILKPNSGALNLIIEENYFGLIDSKQRIKAGSVKICQLSAMPEVCLKNEKFRNAS